MKRSIQNMLVKYEIEIPFVKERRVSSFLVNDSWVLEFEVFPKYIMITYAVDGVKNFAREMRRVEWRLVKIVNGRDSDEGSIQW